jgi:hypothetical protein
MADDESLCGSVHRVGVIVLGVVPVHRQARDSPYFTEK